MAPVAPDRDDGGDVERGRADDHVDARDARSGRLGAARYDVQVANPAAASTVFPNTVTVTGTSLPRRRRRRRAHRATPRDRAGHGAPAGGDADQGHQPRQRDGRRPADRHGRAHAAAERHLLRRDDPRHAPRRARLRRDDEHPVRQRLPAERHRHGAARRARRATARRGSAGSSATSPPPRPRASCASSTPPTSTTPTSPRARRSSTASTLTNSARGVYDTHRTGSPARPATVPAPGGFDGGTNTAVATP